MRRRLWWCALAVTALVHLARGQPQWGALATLSALFTVLAGWQNACATADMLVTTPVTERQILDSLMDAATQSLFEGLKLSKQSGKDAAQEVAFGTFDKGGFGIVSGVVISTGKGFAPSVSAPRSASDRHGLAVIDAITFGAAALTTDLGALGEPDTTSIVLSGVPTTNATLLLDFVFASRELPEVRSPSGSAHPGLACDAPPATAK